MDGGGGISTAAVYFRSKAEIVSPTINRATRIVAETQKHTANVLSGLCIRLRPKLALSKRWSHESFSVREIVSLFRSGRVDLRAFTRKGGTTWVTSPFGRAAQLRTHKPRQSQPAGQSIPNDSQ